MLTTPGAAGDAAGPAPPLPTDGSVRLTVLDALRGFALGGVLLMNMAAFSGIVFMSPEQLRALPTAAVDLPAAALMVWLTYGKFYSIFSLLFGIGFALQLDAALRRGDMRLTLFKRRLLVLLGIGLVHMYVWEGDILVLYALIGFLLLPLRHVETARLPWLAAVLVGAPVLLQVIITMSGGAADPGAPLWRAGERLLVAQGFAAEAMPYPVLATAGWEEYLRFQLSGPFFRYAELLTSGRPFKVLAMFALGLWIGRTGLLRAGEAAVPLLRRVRAWGLALGLPAAGVHAALFLAGGAPATWLEVAESMAYALGVAPLALAYAASFALLHREPRWRRRLERLAPAGRMALTSYLSQTALQIALFYGIGLGLMGRVGAIWLPLATVVILVGQVAVSTWWLGRFRFGPLEWLWRQATYGRRLPIGASPPVPLV